MVEYNPYAYELHEDPYPIYERMRRESPVLWNEELGFWALARHRDVLAGFKDTEGLSSSYGVSLEPSASHPEAHQMMSFLAMDPPRHDHMRALVSRGFTPRRIADLEVSIREQTVAYIEGFIASGRCDFIADLAGRIPMDVISEMLGVAEADRDSLRSWADTVVHREEGMFDVPSAGTEAAAKLVEYFNDLIADHHCNPGEDLISSLLAAELDGQRLSDDEVLSFTFLMIIAGNETTTKLLGNAAYWIWRNPQEREKVIRNPDLVPNWVEETLRYDPSTQALARIATTDIEFGDVRVGEGDRVYLLIGSGNRDEEIFERADSYAIERDTSRSLHFGQGTHFCLGAALARLEGKVVLEEVVRRMPNFEIDADAAERVHSINVRGFAKLPMTL